MAHTGVRARPQPARHRAREPVSSRVAAAQSEGISLPQPAQMPRLQRHANISQARPLTPRAAARREYRRDRCLPPPLPAGGAKRKPKPSALRAGCPARHRAAQTQSRYRKLQRLLSVQVWTRESRLRRGRIAALPPDRDSAPPDYSAYAFRVCASWQGPGRPEREDKGYSRGAARGHPTRTDERHHLNPVGPAEKEHAIEQPIRAQ